MGPRGGWAVETIAAQETGTVRGDRWDARRRWLMRGGGVLLAVLYCALWGASGLLPINRTDLDVFFLPSARLILAGHAFDFYRLRYETIYPNANGPLSMLPLTAVTTLIARLGWLDDPALRRMLVMGVFASFQLLMSREVLLAADRLRGAAYHGSRRLLAYALIALSPELWHGVLLYGHIELPIMLWLVLAAARALAEERETRAGVLLGLALLTRSAALLYLLPLGLVLLRRQGARATVRWGGAALAVVALGLLPFWLADRTDLIYSLVTFHGGLPMGGGSLWSVAPNAAIQAFARQHDSAVALAAALASSLAVLALRRDLAADSRDVYLLLALTSLCLPLFMKALWPYYYLDASVLTALWWLATPRARAAASTRTERWRGLLLPAAAVACALAGERGVTATSGGAWPLSDTLLVVGGTLALAAVLAWQLWRGGGARQLLVRVMLAGARDAV